MVLLQPGTGRQKDVSQFGGRRQEKVGDGQKIQFFQGIIYFPGICARNHWVRPDQVANLDGIGLFFQYRIPGALGGDDGHPGSQPVFIASKLLGLLFRRQCLVVGEFGYGAGSRRLVEYIAARSVQVSGCRHKTHGGPGKIGAVDVLFRGHTPVDTGRSGGGVQPGRLANQIPVDPGDFLHEVQGIVFFDPFHKLIPAVDILGDKFLVVQFLFNNDIMEAQGQGRVRARPDL